MLQGYPKHVSASTSSECMVPACARTPVPAADLCPQHVDELTRTLAQVARLMVPLRRSTLRVTTHRSYTARPSGGGELRDVSAAWNPAATPVASQVDDYAGFLARTIVRERVMPTGQSIGFTLEDRPELQLTVVARRHGGWLGRYPDLGPDVLDSMKGLLRRMEAALSTTPVRRVLLERDGEAIRCRDVVLETDYGPVLCESPLAAILASDDHATPSRIVCTADRDHTSYAPSQWDELVTAWTPTV